MLQKRLWREGLQQLLHLLLLRCSNGCFARCSNLTGGLRMQQQLAVQLLLLTVPTQLCFVQKEGKQLHACSERYLQQQQQQQRDTTSQEGQQQQQQQHQQQQCNHPQLLL